MPTIEARISASAGDVQEGDNGGGFVATEPRLYVSSSLQDYNRSNVAARFLIAIPQGATITAAALTIHLDVDWWNNLRATITAEDADASADFASNPSIATRSRTSAAVDWTELGLSVGNHTSPDLSSVIQAVVDRPGFGGVITLIVAGQIVSTYAECRFQAYDGSPSDAPLLHVEYEESGTTTIDAQISAGSDDGTRYGTTFGSNGVNVYVGTYAGVDENAYFRFPLVLPSGVTITAAHLEMCADHKEGAGNVLSRIYACAADNPSAPTTLEGFDGLAKTTAFVPWEIAAWELGAWYSSPDLTAVVQEWANRPGRESGDALLLQHLNNGSAEGSEIYTHAMEFQDGSYGARLHVEYSQGGGGAVSGTLAATLGGLSPAATGQSLARGGLASTLGSVSAAASGRSLARGSLAGTLGGITLQATGTTGAQAAASGSLEAVLGGITAQAAGTTIARGALSATLSGVSAQAAGTVLARGGLETALGGVAAQAAGTTTARGALTATLSGISAQANGRSPARGGLTAALGGLNLQAAGTAQSVALGTLAAALGGLGLQATGSAQSVTLTAVPWQRLGALAAEARRGGLPVESRRSALPIEQRIQEVENAAI